MNCLSDMICACCKQQKPDNEFYPDAEQAVLREFCRSCRFADGHFRYMEFKQKWDQMTMEEKRKYMTVITVDNMHERKR